MSARLLLADLDADSERTSRLLADAAADAAGHPHLMARVHLYQADVAMRSGELSSCLADLEQAEALAGDSTELMTRILSVRGPVELFTDGARAIRTYRHGVRLTEGGPLTEAAVYLRAGLAVARLRQGGVSVAVRDLELLRGDVEAAGRFRELGDVLHVLTVAYERAAGAGRRTAQAWPGRASVRISSPTPDVRCCCGAWPNSTAVRRRPRRRRWRQPPLRWNRRT
ncbi:hypothetical protein ACFQY4_19450 [Catellatospora bangladeshensis]|uniref:hypothetical protein n=1 Tax=Catellatospora bangladeshensis TaxID=310355 RepID=UPI003621A19E